MVGRVAQRLRVPVVQAIRTSTRHLQILGKGDSLSNFIGPLGMPGEIEKVGTVFCADGDVGVAPIYPITRAPKVTSQCLAFSCRILANTAGESNRGKQSQSIEPTRVTIAAL